MFSIEETVQKHNLSEKEVNLIRDYYSQLSTLPLSGENPISVSIDEKDGCQGYYVNMIERTKLTVLHYNDEEDYEVLYAVHLDGELLAANRSKSLLEVN